MYQAYQVLKSHQQHCRAYCPSEIWWNATKWSIRFSTGAKLFWAVQTVIGPMWSLLMYIYILSCTLTYILCSVTHACYLAFFSLGHFVYYTSYCSLWAECVRWGWIYSNLRVGTMMLVRSLPHYLLRTVRPCQSRQPCFLVGMPRQGCNCQNFPAGCGQYLYLNTGYFNRKPVNIVVLFWFFT